MNIYIHSYDIMITLFKVVLPEISACVLIDRASDMITPLLSQLTYEGLVEECIGDPNNPNNPNYTNNHEYFFKYKI